MISSLFRKIIFLLNLLAAFLLAMTYLSSYIAPDTVPLVAMLGLAYPYFLILNFLFVLFWVIFKKWYFLLSVFVIFSGWNRINNTFRLPLKKEPLEINGAEIKLMSFNVRVFDLYNWTSNHKTRDKIFSLIRKEAPAIACFQEYYNQSDGNYPVHDSLMQNQRFKYSHVYYTDIVNEGKSRFGIATYSAYPIVNKQVILYGKSNNLTIYTDIEINHDTIRVFNNHLQSFRLNKNDYQLIDNISQPSKENRFDGMRTLYGRFVNAFKVRGKQSRKLAKEIENSPYPVLFCGDFNDTPSSYAYHQIDKVLNDSHRTNGHWAGNTYARFFPSFRIDYIFYSDRFVCTHYGNIREKLSDHYPVVGTYRLP